VAFDKRKECDSVSVWVYLGPNGPKECNERIFMNILTGIGIDKAKEPESEFGR
jgi:hypothetical protein